MKKFRKILKKLELLEHTDGGAAWLILEIFSDESGTVKSAFRSDADELYEFEDLYDLDSWLDKMICAYGKKALKEKMRNEC